MAKLFQAQLPQSRPRREVWLAVVLAHLVLLWFINLFWPVQRIVSQVVIQVFRPASVSTASNSDTPPHQTHLPTLPPCLLCPLFLPSQQCLPSAASRAAACKPVPS